MAKSVGSVIRTTVTTVIILAIVVASVIAFQNRQFISDAIAAQQFTPSPEITALNDAILLTDAGHRIFYASEPTLDSSQHFNEQCDQVAHAEGGHVLGCYVSSQIHLFQVTDERLAGIVEATAAHELLHATFARMGEGERNELIALLNNTYEDIIVTNPELEERMSVYNELSDVAFANELHSVLATEVRELPDELELHYQQWLTDRQLIVTFYDTSHEVFAELQARASELEAVLTALREDVEQRSANYDAAVAQFNADVAQFSGRNQNFEFSDSPELFYQVRDSLDSRRLQLTADLDALNADIARYDTLRAELHQLSEINSELLSHLNSELAPPSTAPTQ